MFATDFLDCQTESTHPKNSENVGSDQNSCFFIYFYFWMSELEDPIEQVEFIGMSSSFCSSHPSEKY